MITIRITNVKQIVRQKKGRLAAAIGGLVVDLEAAVEKEVIKQIRAALRESGVEAIIERVPTSGGV